MEIITLLGGYDRNFTYIVVRGNECIVIDPAVKSERVFAEIEQRNFTVHGVIFLHSHFDHILDLDKYREKGWKIYGHQSTEIQVDEKLNDGDSFFEFKVMHTPGHRYDCLCLFGEGKIFTSDTLFVEGCGRVDLEGSDSELMFSTLQRLQSLPDETVVYPGHDYGSAKTSTIGREKVNNRFLGLDESAFLSRRL